MDEKTRNYNFEAVNIRIDTAYALISALEESMKYRFDAVHEVLRRIEGVMDVRLRALEERRKP